MPSDWHGRRRKALRTASEINLMSPWKNMSRPWGMVSVTLHIHVNVPQTCEGISLAAGTKSLSWVSN